MLLKVRETIGSRIESASSGLEKSVKVFAGSRVCSEDGLLSNKECGQVWPFVWAVRRVRYTLLRNCPGAQGT